MAKAIQRDEAKRNRAAFLNIVAESDGEFTHRMSAIFARLSGESRTTDGHEVSGGCTRTYE